MFKVSILVISLVSTLSFADDTKYYSKGKEITKADSIKILVLDPKGEVIKCQAQELTNKATLRNK